MFFFSNAFLEENDLEQCSEQNLPEPYVPSCSTPQFSHIIFDSQYIAADVGVEPTHPKGASDFKSGPLPFRQSAIKRRPEVPTPIPLVPSAFEAVSGAVQIKSPFGDRPHYCVKSPLKSGEVRSQHTISFQLSFACRLHGLGYDRSARGCKVHRIQLAMQQESNLRHRLQALAVCFQLHYTQTTRQSSDL